MTATWVPLDAPPFPATGYAPLADAVGRILGTRNDVLLIQAEAAVALEAVAQSLGAGQRVLNVVTSLYGRWFGDWLRRAGAEVTDLAPEPGQPVMLEAVEAALRGPYDMLALVHAESAYGILNPLPEIVALAKARGMLVVVDAVASVGGHALAVDDLGIDVAVIGPQKALGGQAGVSAMSVSKAAWERVAPQGAAPSILSLADQRVLWLETGRGALPGTPSALEFYALQQAIARVEAEGLAALCARHARAAAAARAGARALTGREWVAPEQASNLVTAVALPDGVSAARIVQGDLSAGVGLNGDRLIRLNHTGPRARLDTVLGDLARLGHALGIAAGPALSAAEEAWHA